VGEFFEFLHDGFDLFAFLFQFRGLLFDASVNLFEFGLAIELSVLAEGYPIDLHVLVGLVVL
jgi:hypothetical protein